MSIDPIEDARETVKAKKDFYGHLSAYLAVNVCMFILVFVTSGRFSWFIPALLWGGGLAIHYFSAFGLPGIGPFESKEWEEQQLRKELAKRGLEIDDHSSDESLELRDIDIKPPRKAKPSPVYKSDDLV